MKLHGLELLVVVVCLALVGCALPRHSEQGIRQQMLSKTPIGSSYAVVLGFAKKKGWPVDEQHQGYVVPEVGKSYAQSKIVGDHLISAYLGGYLVFLGHTDVDCIWVFDDQDKLIDVFVDKQTDSL